MVFVEKFSEFPTGTLDTAVGLKNGANTKGQAGGGGTGGHDTFTFTQVAPALAVSNWVRLDSTGLYQLAQGDIAQDADVIGIIIASPATGQPANTYIVQQSGHLDASLNVFNSTLGGVCQNWFLDTAVAGNMVTADATINNQVSRPVFVNDGPNSGWVLPYRGMIVGGAIPNSGGTVANDSNIVTVTMNGHPFNVSNWVRVSTPPNLILNQPLYDFADNTSLTNSQAVGVVIATTINQFTVQFGGINVGAVTMDDMGNPVTPATVYYLSSTPGAITSTPPTDITKYNKPVYICEQTGLGPLSTGVYRGYVLPQRPIGNSLLNNNIHTVVQNNTFAVGDQVYIKPDETYGLAQADNISTSQVAGTIVARTATQFVIQQSGWVSGVVSVDQSNNPLVSGNVYYLSTSTPGKLQLARPSVLGQYIKACYVQENLATLTGEILPQVALPVPSSGGVGWTVISVQNIVNQPFIDVLNIAGFYRYMIIFETVTPTNNGVVLNMLTSSNNGVSFDSGVADYSWGTYFNAGGYFAVTDSKISLHNPANTASSAIVRGGFNGQFEMINPAQVNTHKQIQFVISYPYSADNRIFAGSSAAGVRLSAAIVNAVRFFFNVGNVATGKVTLLGTNS